MTEPNNPEKIRFSEPYNVSSLLQADIKGEPFTYWWNLDSTIIANKKQLEKSNQKSIDNS